MRYGRHWILASLSVALIVPVFMHIVPRAAYAQDLKDELDALEDFPEDDSSTMDPTASPKAKAKTAPKDKSPIEAPLEKKESPLLGNDVPLDDLEQELGGAPTNKAPKVGQSMTGIDLGDLGKVTSLEFRQLTDRVRLTMRADRPVEFKKELRSKRKQVILDLKNMHIARSVLKRALDTGEFDGPVALVQAFDSKLGAAPSVKVLFQLRNFTEPTVLATGNNLYVDFPVASDGALFRTSQRNVEVPATVVGINEATRFTGARISLNVKDADLSDVLNLLTRSSGKNFILGPEAKGKVTMNVRNIPWDQVFTMILVNNKLGYQVVGNTYRIMTNADLQNEFKTTSEAQLAADNLQPLETRLITLSYAQASDVEKQVKDFLTKGRSSGSAQPSIATDQRTNTLVVTDTASAIERINRYVRSLDRQTPQVLIEGRIVEAEKTFSRSLGVKWGLVSSTGNLKSSTVNVGSLGTQSGGTGAGAGAAALGAATSSAAAAAAQAAGAAATGTSPATTTIATGAGNAGAGQLDISWSGLAIGPIRALLDAAESESKLRTIASPRALVSDNQTATVEQGDQFPITTAATANAPATTTLEDAKLKLEVKPRISADGFVFMNIKLSRALPKAFSNGTGKSDRKIDTQLLVESGKTAVIGGVYFQDTTDTESGVPALRKIPIFGRLFTDSKTFIENTKEMIMFISPRIVNADKAALAVFEEDAQEGTASKGGFKASQEEISDETF